MTIGPNQPMAGGGAVQEDFRAMVNHVLSFKPDCQPQLAKRRLNTRLRQIQDGKLWSGLLVRGEITVPDAYSTGAIALTSGSDEVIGTSTGWPINDAVNTTLSQAITVANELQDVVPASMTGIAPGHRLLIDAAGASKEYLLVFSIGATSFKAKPTLTHAVGQTIWKSSLTGRQFRVATKFPFYTIRGVGPGQTLKLDMPFGAPSVANSNYQIVQAYVAFEQNLRMIWSVVNTTRGWPIRLGVSQDIINAYNAWRQSTGWVLNLVDYAPDEIGRWQVELSPTPTQKQAIPYLAYRKAPDMVEETDTPPPGIPSHLLVHGAIADVILSDPKSPYYNPALAQHFLGQFNTDLVAAQLGDDDIQMRAYTWAASQYSNFMPRGADFWQSHEIDAWMGDVGW